MISGGFSEHRRRKQASRRHSNIQQGINQPSESACQEESVPLLPWACPEIHESRRGRPKRRFDFVKSVTPHNYEPESDSDQSDDPATAKMPSKAAPCPPHARARGARPQSSSPVTRTNTNKRATMPTHRALGTGLHLPVAPPATKPLTPRAQESTKEEEPSTPKARESDQCSNDETGEDTDQSPTAPLSPVVAWGDSIVENLGQHFLTDDEVAEIIRGARKPISLTNKSLWKALNSFNFADQPRLIGHSRKIPPHVLVADDWKTSLTNAIVYAFGDEDMQQRERVKFRAASALEKQRLHKKINSLHDKRNQMLRDPNQPRPTGIVYPRLLLPNPPQDQRQANREMEGTEMERSKNKLERLRQLVGHTESQALKNKGKKRQRSSDKEEDDTPKIKYKRRHFGEPPTSIGAQSDGIARRAEESALTNCSKAIITMHFPGKGLGDDTDDKTKMTEEGIDTDDDEQPIHGFSLDDHGNSLDAKNTAKDKGNKTKETYPYKGFRNLGVPPTSIGAQSDTSSRKAEMSAIDHCASAIMTMHFPSSDPETPIHTMMLVVLDEVVEQIGAGGRLRHGPAPIPRLTVLAYDEATAGRVLQKLNEQFLFRDDKTDLPPCIKEQLYTGTDLSLIDTVAGYIKQKQMKLSRLSASGDSGDAGEENFDQVNQESSNQVNQHEERDMTDCGPDSPIHSMLLVILDEVVEQGCTGGRLKQRRATTPRLTVMAYDPATAGRILQKLNEQILHRRGVPPPCRKDEIYGTADFSLVDAVARHKEKVKLRRAKLMKLSDKSAPTFRHTFGM